MSIVGGSGHRTWTLTKMVAAIASIVLAVSCSSGSPGPDDGADSNTLTWYAGAVQQGQLDYRQVLKDEFEKTYPSIRITLAAGPSNTDSNRDDIKTRFKDGKNEPDVYMGDVIWPAQFAHDGLARALDTEFEPEFWKRFPPQLLSNLKYHNTTYAVPLFADQGMLYYRKDLVTTPPTTWEQLVSDAKNLQDQKKVDYGFVWHGAQYEGLTCIWTEMLADAGGSTLNDTHTRSQINSPQAHKALTFLRDLVSEGISPKEVTHFQEPDANYLFASGHAAFLRGWNSGDARIITFPDIYDKVGVAPLPTFAGQPGPGYSTIGGWSLFVNPHSRRLAAAKTFIRWLTDVQAQHILTHFSQIPVNVTVRSDSAIRNKNPAVAAGLDAHPVGRPSDMPAYPDVSKAVYSHVNDAVNGSSLPEDALRDADQDINKALR